MRVHGRAGDVHFKPNLFLSAAYLRADLGAQGLASTGLSLGCRLLASRAPLRQQQLGLGRPLRPPGALGSRAASLLPQNFALFKFMSFRQSCLVKILRKVLVRTLELGGWKVGVFLLTQAWVCSHGVSVWIHLLYCLHLVPGLLNRLMVFAWHWVEILATRICREPSAFGRNPKSNNKPVLVVSLGSPKSRVKKKG